jgi:DNA-directed RNA polymerase beta' subunit
MTTVSIQSDTKHDLSIDDVQSENKSRNNSNRSKSIAINGGKPLSYYFQTKGALQYNVNDIVKRFRTSFLENAKSIIQNSSQTAPSGHIVSRPSVSTQSTALIEKSRRVGKLSQTLPGHPRNQLCDESDYSRYDKLTFGIATPELIRNFAVSQIKQQNLYTQTKYVPTNYKERRIWSGNILPDVTIPDFKEGVNDATMGTGDPNLSCKTCGGDFCRCRGHAGGTELIIPVCNPAKQFLEKLMKVLKCVCVNCGICLIPKEERAKYEVIADPNKRLDKIVEACENTRYCKEKHDRLHFKEIQSKRSTRKQRRKTLFTIQFAQDMKLKKNLMNDDDSNSTTISARSTTSSSNRSATTFNSSQTTLPTTTPTTTTPTTTPTSKKAISTKVKKRKFIQNSSSSSSSSLFPSPSTPSSNSKKKAKPNTPRSEIIALDESDDQERGMPFDSANNFDSDKKSVNGNGNKQQSPLSTDLKAENEKMHDETSSSSSSSDSDNNESSASENEEEEQEGESSDSDINDMDEALNRKELGMISEEEEEGKQEQKEDSDQEEGKGEEGEEGDAEKDEDKENENTEKDVDEYDDDNKNTSDVEDEENDNNIDDALDPFEEDASDDSGGDFDDEGGGKKRKRKRKGGDGRSSSIRKKSRKRTAEEKEASSKKRLVTKRKKLQLIQDLMHSNSHNKQDNSNTTPTSYILTGDETQNPIAPKKTKGYVSKSEASIEKLQKEAKAEMKDYESDMVQAWRPSPDDQFSFLKRPLDEASHERGEGCGHPVPIITRVELDIIFTYLFPWEGDASKKEWEEKYKHTPYSLYNLVQRISNETQEFLGINWRKSPVRGYMIMCLSVMAVNKRVAKAEGSKAAMQDDATTYTRSIIAARNKLLHSLIQEGIAFNGNPNPNEEPILLYNYHLLPSENRRIFWVKRPLPSTPCVCNSSSGRRCSITKCGASGSIVECKCKIPNYCRCIIDSLPEKSPLRQRMTKIIDNDPEIQKHINDNRPMLTPTGRKKARVKTWSDFYRLMCNEIVAYMVGELDRKNESKRNKQTGVSAWNGTNNQVSKAAKQIKSIVGKQKGKGGRWRGNLGSRRADFTHRAVVGPDIHLSIDELGVPLSAMRKLTLAHSINKINRAKIMDKIRMRKVVSMQDPNNHQQAYKLKYLDTNRFIAPETGQFECEIENGVLGLANRQPSLHKPSIQGVHLRGLPTFTNSLNLINTPPFNADFDGDEMNLFFTRSLESQAETLELKMASKQFRSQQGCKVVMGLVQNACLASYLWSRRNTFFNRDQMMYLFGQFSLNEEDEEDDEIRNCFYRFFTEGLPIPAILKPQQLWTGAQAFSMFLPRKLFVGQLKESYSMKNSSASNGGGQEPLIIRDGEMLAGTLTKETMGPTSNSLPHILVNDKGNHFLKRWMEIWQLIVNSWLENKGITMTRAEYQMDGSDENETFRQNLLDKLDEYSMKEENQNYNIIIPNQTEVDIVNAQDRVQEILGVHLELEMSKRPISGLRACTNSGTKGSDKHIHQYGACQGAQQANGDRRMDGVSAHYNVTQHLVEAHGFVQSSLTRSNKPGPYFSHSKCSRTNLTSTSRNVPSTGYLQRCLNIVMAGIHIQLDGTVRDSNGNIIQYRYGDDGFDPSYQEYLPLIFFTPDNKANESLRTKRAKLFQQMEILYRESELEPRSLVGPIEIQRMMGRTVYQFKQSLKEKQYSSQQIATLVIDEVDSIREQWFKSLVKSIHNVFSENLLLQVILEDALSSYHISDILGLDGKTMVALCEEMEHYITRAIAPPGEMVGIIAGQSTGEPLTQDFLGMFKSVGQKALMTIAGDQSSLLSSIGPDEQLRDTLNASRRENIASMTASLKPMYSSSYYAASVCCQQLPCRRLLTLVTKLDRFPEGKVDSWPDEWARKRIFYQHPDMARSVHWCPTIRLELNKSLCRTLNLTLANINRDIIAFFKHGIYVLHSGDDDNPRRPNEFTLYIHVDLSKNQSLIKRITSFQEKQPHLKINYDATIIAVIIRCLNMIICRGMPQVSSAYPIEISRYTYDSSNIKSPLVKTTEWGIKTKGSNLESLISYPFIKPESCKTTSVHEVKRLFGINGAGICCNDSLDTLIRSVSKMAYHHVRLMADVMTYTGFVVSFTRAGLKIITRSPLHLAGFEEIMKNIFIAATSADTDHLTNPMSTVMVGNRPPVGTAIGIQMIQASSSSSSVSSSVSASVSSSSSISSASVSASAATTTTSSPSSISILSESANVSNAIIPSKNTPDKVETNDSVVKTKESTYRETILSKYRAAASYSQREVSVYPMEWPFYNLFLPKQLPSSQGLIDLSPNSISVESDLFATTSIATSISKHNSSRKQEDYFFSDRPEEADHYQNVGADTSMLHDTHSSAHLTQLLVEKPFIQIQMPIELSTNFQQSSENPDFIELYTSDIHIFDVDILI